MSACAASLHTVPRRRLLGLLIIHSSSLPYFYTSNTFNFTTPRQIPASFFRSFSQASVLHAAAAAAATGGSNKYIAWPTKPNPDPYEIFNFTRQDFDRSELKRRYRVLVKQYHPDTAQQLTSDSARAANKIIRDRFHRIVAAYEILDSTTKKSSFDVLGAGWNYADVDPVSKSSQPKPSYTQYRHDPFRDERMWASGQTYDRRTGRAPQTPRSKPVDHEKNTRTLMWIILCTTVITFLQSLRVMTWSVYDQGIPPAAFASIKPSNEVLTKLPGIDPDGACLPETLFSDSAPAEATEESQTLSRIRKMFEALHAQAVLDGIDRDSSQFKGIEEKYMEKCRRVAIRQRHSSRGTKRALDILETDMMTEYDGMKNMIAKSRQYQDIMSREAEIFSKRNKASVNGVALQKDGVVGSSQSSGSNAAE
ncbi:uncharacterized protein V2V93DRAFT_375049 [Kockiozyma suomiensis]|uniref:uncharacterized protein n=1 Tax=Kockiozyma suomiensis TaxID=1337062 RepID=UPI003344160A